jgi:hypothetical protein
MPGAENAAEVPSGVLNQARSIVEKAIAQRGDVASLRSQHGPMRNFFDTIAPAIWDNYVADALAEVDAGNWQRADEIARQKAIGNTVTTLMNQS